MNIKFKRLSEDAVAPFRKHEWDAGVYLTAISVLWDAHTSTFVYGTGIAVEIPPGYVGLIFPRSSIYKTDLTLVNSVGVIDADYRGEIRFRFNAPVVDRIEVDNTCYNIQHNMEAGNGIVSPSAHTTYDIIDVYKIGDRIGQLVIVPIPPTTYVEVEELSETERGEGGFGSTNAG